MFKDLRSSGLLVAGAGLLLAGLVGCPSYTFLEVLPERVTENQIIVEPGKPVPADILFVVDNSPSMEEEQENLAINFAAFIDELTKAKADYRIAVVTTDLTSRDTSNNEAQWAGITRSGFSNAAPFVFQNQVRAECRQIPIGHGCLMGPDQAKRLITSEMSPQEQISTFQANVRVGSCGSGTEEGISATIKALERMAPGGCNEGFLRPAANLVVVILSDEDDQSLGRDIDEAIAALANLKPLSRVRISAIVGAEQTPNGATAGRCKLGGGRCGGACEMYGPAQGSLNSCMRESECPGGSGEVCGTSGQCVQRDYVYWRDCHWCSYYNAPDCCSALAGSRYMAFASALEAAIASATGGDITSTGCIPSSDPEVRVGCLVDSICQESFSQTLKRIASDLVIVPTVALDPPATYPPGVVVKVNGVELENGVDFTISEDGATLRYSPGKTPGQGDVVEVFYTIPE